MNQTNEPVATKKATPDAKLLGDLMNPNVPKTEREHMAVRHIEYLLTLIHDGTNSVIIPSEEYAKLKEDAERWNWLANDCDGNKQDDFIQWMAKIVASKEYINEAIDEARSAK